MSNRKGIAEALGRSSGSTRTATTHNTSHKPTAQEQPKTRPASRENPHYRPGRQDKSNVTGYFPPEVKKQLRLIAAEEETTIQELLAEALNGLFARYGKPEIAPINDKK